MTYDDSDFQQRLTYLFRRISGALAHELDLNLQKHQLTQAQLSALAQLQRVRPAALSGADLAKRSGVTPQSMSAALADLLSRGLVTRSPNPTHGRKLDMTISATGLALVETVQRETRATDDARDLGLSAAEEGQLRRLLHKMTAALGLDVP